MAYWIGDANPHAGLGRSVPVKKERFNDATQHKGQSIPRKLTVSLRPGHPLCDHCHRPLEARSTGDGALELRCDGGHAPIETEVAALVRQGSRALLGVLADGHRLDQEAPEGLVLHGQDRVGCVSCGAPLATTGRERLVRCDFCGASTHIAATVRHQLQRDPEPDTLWLAFQGPSTLRLKLERDPSTWGRSKQRSHEEIVALEVKDQPLSGPALLAMTWGAPLAALAIAGLVVLAWVFASVTWGLPLPDLSFGP